MVKFSEITHPLVREGKGRDKRYLSSLSTDYIKIDERQLEDLLEFMYRFSKEVYYYDEDLSKETWTDFFVKSVPFQIALISKYDVEKIWKEYFQISNSSQRKLDVSIINLLIDRIYRIAYQIDIWCADLEEDRSGFRVIIENIISTNLRHSLVDLIGFSNSAVGQGNHSNRSFQFFFQKEVWELSSENLYAKEKEGLGEEVSDDIHKRIDDIFLTFWKAIVQIVEEAPEFLEKSIVCSKKQDHQAHIGLFLAFIRLFEHVQNDLNRFTSRHLNFFYRDVLKLQELNYVPDKIHLVLELSKIATEFVLPKGTLFKGSKDKNGEPINFYLEDEAYISKAGIKSLKTLFLDQIHLANANEQKKNIVKGVYMAPEANSANGRGEGFTTQDPPVWSTMGGNPSKFLNEKGELEAHPFANIGLILGTPILYLPEGKRSLTISIKCSVNKLGSEDFINDVLKVKEQVETCLYFSTEIVNVLLEEDLSLEAKSYVKNKKGKKLRSGDNDIDFGKILDKDYKEVFETLESELLETDKKLILQIVERKHGFDLSLSGEKEWLKPNEVVIKMLLDKNDKDEFTGVFSLHYYVDLSEDFDPVEFYNADEMGVDLNTKDPLLKLTLNHSRVIVHPIHGSVSLYNYFKNIGIIDANIDIQVCGVRNLVIQNDNGLMDPAKKFQPFGAQPKNGSKFYIGSKEIFKKRFKAARVNINWENTPKSFGDYYVMYTGNNSPIFFSANVKVLTGKNWKNIFNISDIFSSSVKDPEISCESIETTHIYIKNKIAEIPVQPTTLDSKSEVVFWDQTTKDGFIQLELKDDFKHEDYVSVFTRQFQAQAASVASPRVFLSGAVYKKNNTVPPVYGIGPIAGEEVKNWEAQLPNEPYTPTINGFSIDYTASANSKDLNLLHLYPFEGTFLKRGIPSGNTLFPNHKEEGNLFIGLVNIEPGNNLNLYFKLAEATANPEVDRAEVEWSFLSSNEWKPLRKDFEVLKDETNGLIESGIITFSLPYSINLNNSILSSDNYWIKASVNNNIKAIAETELIAPHGVRAIFLPKIKNDLSRLSQQLKEKTISKLVEENANLKSVLQPYPSFGGKAPEPESNFNLRISEHLKHKNRTITIFDYERIVLENFLEVFKAKCIPHTLGIKGRPRDYEMAPGFVTVAVIPDLKLIESANRYEPQLPLSKLEKIKGFLKTKLSPFIRLQILNPRYERVDVWGEVRFKEGKSTNYYLSLIATDLKNFMAPWAIDDQSSISFGGKVFQSTLLNFLESLDYVDYIRNFAIKKQAHLELETVAKEEITASTARSILVSGEINFNPILEDCCTQENDKNDKMKGIGYAKIP